MQNHAIADRAVRAVDIFYDQLDKFSRFFDTRRISVEVVDKHFDSRCAYRDMAWAEIRTDGREKYGAVKLTRKALNLCDSNIIALFRHEIGHCVDPFLSTFGAEQRADDIAYLVCGDKIRYDKKLIQTIGSGIWPRPHELRR